MSALHRFFNTLLHRDSHSSDVAAELDFHIAERTRENLAAGMNATDARHDARLRFGNPTLLKDQTRDVGVWYWADTFLRESSQALRSLARRPVFALTVILTLSIAIGANSSLFSIVDAVLLKPFPLPDPDRLVVIEESKAGTSVGGNPQRVYDWNEQLIGTLAVGGLYEERVPIITDAGPERVLTIRTVASTLAALGVHPARGRAFTAQEERGEGAPVVLLSDGCWRRRYAGSPDILGRAVELGSTHPIVIGVLPPGLDYPAKVDFYQPAPKGLQQGRRASFLLVLARLKPGISIPQLQSQLTAVASRLATTYPETDGGLSARPVGFQAREAAAARTPLLVLMATVGFVLIIACVNIAGLLLARAAERQRESSIRLSLGAGRASIVRLYLIESLWLSLVGGALGLVFASFGLAAWKRILPDEIPRLEAASLDWRVALFAFAASLLCASFCGLSSGLWHGGGLRLRQTMVVAQVALSLVLLIGAGLMTKSFLQLSQVPLGFPTDHLVTVAIHLPWDSKQSHLDQFQSEVRQAFAAIPGVRQASFIDRLPLLGGSQSAPIAIEGREVPPALREAQAYKRAADVAYFETIGLPLLAGRMFREHETVINQTLAKRYFPAGDALGRRLTFDAKPKPGEQPEYFRIVGIVPDLRQSPTQPSQPAEAFIPSQETYWPMTSYVLRVQGDPRSVIAAVRQQLRRIDPRQTIDKISTMDDEVASAVREPKVRVWLILSFAATALLLAAIGLYGVLSSEVSRRTHEIGMRMALGAKPESVLSLMLKRGFAVVGVGLVLGLAGSAFATKFLETMLYNVKPLDPAAIASATLALLVVSLAATYIPARRAARIDPAQALRRD